MTTATRTTYTVGNTVFLAPFNAGGYYVNDARGDTVAECRNEAVARALADMLNAAATAAK